MSTFGTHDEQMHGKLLRFRRTFFLPSSVEVPKYVQSVRLSVVLLAQRLVCDS